MEDRRIVTRVLDAAVDEFWLTHDFQVGFEVTDQEPVSNNIRISLGILLIKQLQTQQVSIYFTKEVNGYVLKSTVEISRHDEISNGQSLANEIRLVKQDAVKILHDPFDLDLSGFHGLFVVDRSWPSEGGTPPFAESGEDFVVREGAPLDDLSVRFDVLRDQSGVRVLLGDCAHKLGGCYKVVQFEAFRDQMFWDKSDRNIVNVWCEHTRTGIKDHQEMGRGIFGPKKKDKRTYDRMQWTDIRRVSIHQHLRTKESI